MLGCVKTDTIKRVTASVSCTWRPPASAAPGAAGSPSLLSRPQTRVSSPPAPCAEPPGSSSSARDAAEATERERTEKEVSTLYRNAWSRMQPINSNTAHKLQHM